MSEAWRQGKAHYNYSPGVYLSNVRTTAYKGISLSLKRNVIVMITTRIQIESYLAEYVRGKYYDETVGTVSFPS